MMGIAVHTCEKLYFLTAVAPVVEVVAVTDERILPLRHRPSRSTPRAIFFVHRGEDGVRFEEGADHSPPVIDVTC